VARSLTDKPKGVVGGDPTNENKTLDEVRSNQDIIEVKWSGKHRVAY
jgi:hypothetical protein